MEYNDEALPQQFSPKTKEQLNKLMDEYYQVAMQVQTLQRHILKIQTQKQVQYKFFNDQVQKLKLYIDQCQNQIRKRQEREVALIDRLKQVEQMEVRSQASKQTQEMKFTCDKFIRARQLSWDEQRLKLVKDNQQITRANMELAGKVSQLKSQIQTILSQKQIYYQQIQKQLSQIDQQRKYFRRLKQNLLLAQADIDLVKRQNAQLKQANSHSQRKHSGDKEKLLPISSSCANCLKLSKINAQQLQAKINQINGLQKDLQSLMAFFEVS